MITFTLGQVSLMIMGIFTVEVIIAILVIRQDIMIFLKPHDYAEIIMLESDNNIRTWVEKKNDTLTLDFNNGSYNMFYGDGEEQNATEVSKEGASTTAQSKEE